jgi:hypothetical protein
MTLDSQVASAVFLVETASTMLDEVGGSQTCATSEGGILIEY